MKPFKLTRLNAFVFFFTAGVIFYLLDCFFQFNRHPDLPWYETGIYNLAGGIQATIALFFAAFYFLIFRRDK